MKDIKTKRAKKKQEYITGMTNLKNLNRVATGVKHAKINWHPGHMFAGLQSMIGKLNTVDCVVEVHDARIPLTGRNWEFRRHLGAIKPHLLLLNKQDLADLSRWEEIKDRLAQGGDKDVMLTCLNGHNFEARGYSLILQKVVDLINNSDRYNRQTVKGFKIMIVGIPNVGKSTLINRLRQLHVGLKGEPAKVGSRAGVTRNVENMIKICARPPIYSIDTPGILAPGCTKNRDQAMRLALCASISDDVLKSPDLTQYLIEYLNGTGNLMYLSHYGLKEPIRTVHELVKAAHNKLDMDRAFEDPHISSRPILYPTEENVCWTFIRMFRKGMFGKMMLDFH